MGRWLDNREVFLYRAMIVYGEGAFASYRFAGPYTSEAPARAALTRARKGYAPGFVTGQIQVTELDWSPNEPSD